MNSREHIHMCVSYRHVKCKNCKQRENILNYPFGIVIQVPYLYVCKSSNATKPVCFYRFLYVCIYPFCFFLPVSLHSFLCCMSINDFSFSFLSLSIFTLCTLHIQNLTWTSFRLGNGRFKLTLQYLSCI